MATGLDTLPAHLLPLVTEEFPAPLARACVCRGWQREPRLHCTQCCIIIEEEEGESGSSLEEVQAQRSFLHTLELLRRSAGGMSRKNLENCPPAETERALPPWQLSST